MYFSKTKIGLREIGNEFAGRAAHSPSFAPTHPPRQIRGEEPDRLTNQDWPKNQCKPVRPRAHLGETQSADQHSDPKQIPDKLNRSHHRHILPQRENSVANLRRGDCGNFRMNLRSAMARTLVWIASDGLHSCERVTCPVPSKPIARAAAGDRSISLPLTQGPRSLMRTVTHLLLQTRTRVPNGNRR